MIICNCEAQPLFNGTEQHRVMCVAWQVIGAAKSSTYQHDITMGLFLTPTVATSNFREEGVGMYLGMYLEMIFKIGLSMNSAWLGI